LEISGSPCYIGGIAGPVGDGSIIRNCYTIGNIDVSGKGNNYAGGITSYLSGSNIIIQNCHTSSNVSTFGSGSFNYVGGITSYLYGSSIIIQNCYTTGNITSSGSNLFRSYAGGIIGYMNGNEVDSGIVKDCYTTGDVASSGALSMNYAGGIAGVTRNSIRNCYTTGNIRTSGSAGGVTGRTESTGNIRNCVALNNAITTSGENRDRHRIGLIQGDVILTGNYGSTTIVATPVGIWVSDVNGKDGADCSARPTESWWRNSNNWHTEAGTSAWDFTDIWQWDSVSGLPKLRNMANSLN